MSGALAQRIALVAHGNAFLTGLIGSAPDLVADSSTFQYVRSVEFRLGKRVNRRVDRWFAELAARGADRLRLLPRSVAVEGNGVREVWTESWIYLSRRFEQRLEKASARYMETGRRDRLDALDRERFECERPWRVYYQQAPRKSRARSGSPLVVSRLALVRAVEDAAAFDRENGVGFAGWFDTSLRLLNAQRPSPPYHRDMFPDVGYSLEARQLLAAATRAWVFGGIGSWNDAWIDDEAAMGEHRRITRNLESAVLTALVSATNAFDRSQSGGSVS